MILNAQKLAAKDSRLKQMQTRYFLMGTAYSRAGKYKQARQCFRRFVKFQPPPSPAHRFLALVGMLRYDEAVQIAEGILDRLAGPQDASYFQTLAYPLGCGSAEPENSRLYREHLQVLHHMTRTRPGCAWYYYYLGRCYFKAHNLDVRDTIAAKALEYFGPLENFSTGRYGWMRHHLGNSNLVRFEFRAALKDFEAVLQSRFPLWEAYCWRAEAYLCLGEKKKAFSEFAKAERVISEDGPRIGLGDQSGTRLGQLYAWRGEMHLWSGDYDLAIRQLDEALKFGSSFALCWRGGANLKQGRMDRALADLNLAIAQRPQDDGEAYVWRGEARYHLGDHQGALEDLGQALSMEDNNSALFLRALVRRSMGNNSGMRSDCAKASPRIIGYIRRKLGLGEEGRLSDRQMEDVLRAWLELSRGVRRQEAFPSSVWMV